MGHLSFISFPHVFLIIFFIISSLLSFLAHLLIRGSVLLLTAPVITQLAIFLLEVELAVAGFGLEVGWQLGHYFIEDSV